MAQASWPSPDHNNRAVTDAEMEQLGVDWSSNGVYGNPTDAAVITAGPGLNVTLRADVYASVRGRVWTSGGTDTTLPIASNVSGQTRVDRAVLRLDRSDWTVRAVIKQGTPGSGPPVLTTGDGFNTFEVLLANIAVLNGAAAVTVTRGERYVGTRIRPATSTPLTDPNPNLGDVRWETDTKRLLLYDGSKDRTIYEESGEVILRVLATPNWGASADSVLELRSGLVTLRLAGFERRVAGLTGTQESRLPVVIPAAYQPPTRSQHFTVYITGLHLGRVSIYAKNDPTRPGQIWLTQHPAMDIGDSVAAESMVWAV